jgi:uncharacterized protein (TIGR02246 family)
MKAPIMKTSQNRREVFAALAAVPVLFAARSADAQEQSAVAEVKALIDAQTAAWNRGDIAGFCAPYAEDCVFLSPSGVTRGRQIVQERYTKKYGAAKDTMGQLGLEILDARATATTVSLAMKWSLRWDAAGKKPAAGLTLIVWQRQPAGWRLIQDASM